MGTTRKFLGKDLREFLERGVDSVVPRERVESKLKNGLELRVKLGIDPTTRDLHLGYAAALRRIRTLQTYGHTAVIVVGAFTGRFGDPTGKGTARTLRSAEETQAAAHGFKKGLLRILLPGRTEIVQNSRWFDKMNVDEFLRICAHFTAHQMLERDMFVARTRSGKEVFLHELLYPVLQAYDSVAIRSDLTIIGRDQLFNELQARKLQAAFGQEPQGLITLKILPGTDGVQKMSQSLGNSIGILETPEEKFGKLMSIPDSAIERYAELLTDLPAAGFARRAVRGGLEARDAKMAVARAIVGEIDGTRAAQKAEDLFVRRFRLRKIPSTLPTFALKKKHRTVLDVLVALGVAPSKSAARRLVRQGGVRVDGQKVLEEHIPVRQGSVLSAGKRVAIRIV